MTEYKIKKINGEFTDTNKIPKSNGVYFFQSQNMYPIYIGKSINLNSRIKSHLYQAKSNAKEKKIKDSSCYITWIECSSEMEALIVESFYVKKYLPIFNRKLRRAKILYSLFVENTKNFKVNIKKHDIKNLQILDNSYGLFKSKKEAQDTIENICKEHKICKKTIGLEKTKNYCFAYQIKHCNGACMDKNKEKNNNDLFLEKISNIKNELWPYNGTIGLKEKNQQKSNIIIIKDWFLVGIAKSIQNLKKNDYILYNNDQEFDADLYKIIKKYIFNKKVTEVKIA